MDEIADETVPYVVSEKVRLSMEKFAEEWVKQSIRDNPELHRAIVAEAMRAFNEAAVGLRGGRRRRRPRRR